MISMEVLAPAGADAHPALDSSLWAATAPPAPLTMPLSGSLDVDVAIVGAGYTGLAAAIALAERGRSVVVVEAVEAGFGASGRNGGQVIPGLRHLPDQLVAAYGRDRGERLYRFGASTADAAFALIDRLGLDCQAVRTGWIQAADSETALAESRERVAAWRALGAAVRLLERAAFRALVGSDAYRGGWIHEGGGQVQPLALARALARAAIARGVRLFTRSPAVSIAREGAGWRIATPTGSISAGKLLVATNALAGSLWPGLAAAALPVWTFQIATAPIAAGHRASILPQAQPVSDTRRVLRYFRVDGHGRVVIGGKGRMNAPRQASDFDLQQWTLARLFPALADHPIEYRWGGQVAVTVDRLPRLFALGPGAFAHLGCNGKGVAWCCAMGPVLADLLDGGDPERSPVPVTALSTIPFHRLRRVYVAAGSAWLRLRDRLEA
jgi:glycine/D-amino acid oxidase-like deaminating enzyme